MVKTLFLLLVLAFASPGRSSTNGSTAGFFSEPVCPIAIEIAREDIARLRRESRKYVRADVRVSGRVFRGAGLHLKGATGSFRQIDDNPGFTLDFGQFGAGPDFYGSRKIHLNNSVEDPSYLREQLGRELFQSAGVPSPRVGHARVVLNGRALGLYVLKEGFAEDFLARVFSRADGELYDTDLGHDVDSVMKQHLGAGGSSQSELRRAADAAAEPDLNRRWERLQATVDMERFLSFVAMEVMICHWDGYSLGRNNFRIYHDPAADRLVFLPTGMDQIFAKADLTWRTNARGLIAKTLLETPAGRARYEERFRSLFAAAFDPERLASRVRQNLSEIQPGLSPGDRVTVAREAAALCEQIVQRHSSLQRQLAEPPVAPLEFSQGSAAMRVWHAVDAPPGGMMEARKSDGGATLYIQAGPITSAAWKTTYHLAPGRYRFEGRVKVRNVAPLPFGKNQGARLRITGETLETPSLAGNSDWTLLQTEFQILESGREVEFVCELRASAGEAWFASDSLAVVRIHSD